LAFAVPTILMFLSILIFLIGKRLYYIKKVDRTQNLIIKLISCILHAIRNKYKHRKSSYKKPHWLDYAQDKYDEQFINDVKAFSRVVLMFVPLPIFWALFDQQVSQLILNTANQN
jgi:solute carrier family 15 oligopeptide transporter 1